MKKVMSIKPLAVATAFAAGTSVSMIAVALPGGGDTLGANGVVNESICVQSVDMTIAGGSRSVTTGTGNCQLRTLPPTKGLVLTNSTPAGGTVNDSAAMVNAGGELYEAYVAGNRDAAVLLTPNRALATSRSVTFTQGADGSVTSNLAVAVQPSTGLQASWLTGTYRIVQRQHNWSMVASGLEESVYATPNLALGERNYVKSLTVDFNGDGTCTVLDSDTRVSASLVKDPLAGALNGYSEMDVNCTVGGGNCGQNSGRNYVAQGVINTGITFRAAPDPEVDWADSSGNGDGLVSTGCTYVVTGSQVAVTYNFEFGTISGIPGGGTAFNINANYNVSADLRYLVSDGNSLLDMYTSGNDGSASKGGMAVGMRVGANSPEGKTYLFNQLNFTNAASTPTTASYENPSTPLNQEEECVSRGELSFAAAGACTYNVVSTCSGRNKSGMEETSAGANDGTITDSLTVVNGSPAVAPTCSWSGSGGALSVAVGLEDPDANPITMQYEGVVSDNGEAITLMGEYAIASGIPDTQNPPLLDQYKYNMQSYLVAQEYQGSLVADADSDGANNYAEWTWGNEIIAQVGAVKSDLDIDGDADILWFDSTSGLSISWMIENGAKAAGGGSLGTRTGAAWTGLGDFDNDGDADQMFQTTAGDMILWTVQNGLKVAAANTGNRAAPYVVDAVADLDADGDSDIVFRDPTGGNVITWMYQNGVKVGGNSLGVRLGTFLAATDLDGDGDADLVYRDAANNIIAWTIQNGVKAGAVNYGVQAGGFVGAGDMDGDGDSDLMWRISGDYMIAWFINGGTKTAGNLGQRVGDDWQALADVDADGDVDLLTRTATTNYFIQWTIQGGVKTASYNYGQKLLPYAPVATNDYNKDGKADILFRDSGTGNNLIWMLDGVGVKTGVSVGQRTGSYVAVK